VTFDQFNLINPCQIKAYILWREKKIHLNSSVHSQSMFKVKIWLKNVIKYSDKLISQNHTCGFSQTGKKSTSCTSESVLFLRLDLTLCLLEIQLANGPTAH